MNNVRAFGFVFASLTLFAAGAHAADPPLTDADHARPYEEAANAHLQRQAELANIDWERYAADWKKAPNAAIDIYTKSGTKLRYNTIEDTREIAERLAAFRDANPETYKKLFGTDGKEIVGTRNLDPRSHVLNREVGVLVGGRNLDTPYDYDTWLTRRGTDGVVHTYNLDPRTRALHEKAVIVGTYSQADWAKIIARLEKEHPNTLALLKKEGLVVKRPGAWDRGVVAISLTALGLLTADSEHKAATGETPGETLQPIAASDRLFRELKMPSATYMEMLRGEPHGEMMTTLPSEYTKTLSNGANGLE